MTLKVFELRNNDVLYWGDNIDRVGYQQGSLFIQFHSGGCYRYDDAPFQTYDLLVKSESAGKVFHSHIKGRYRYTRLDHNPFN